MCCDPIVSQSECSTTQSLYFFSSYLKKQKVSLPESIEKSFIKEQGLSLQDDLNQENFDEPDNPQVCCNSIKAKVNDYA